MEVKYFSRAVFCLTAINLKTILRQQVYYYRFGTKHAALLWRSGVILRSQNGQAEWVRAPVGPHHLSVITRGRWLD